MEFVADKTCCPSGRNGNWRRARAKCIEELIELNAKVNDLGNCMLLEKNFNISKSNRPLKEFLQGVYEFKEGKWTIEEWARALDLGIPLVDSGEAPIEELGELV